MPTVTVINGSNVVAGTEATEKIKNVIDNVYDIGSSGEIGALMDSDWRAEQLGELFGDESLAVVDKHQVFEELISGIETSDGWYVSDIRTLMDLCGVETCSIDF